MTARQPDLIDGDQVDAFEGKGRMRSGIVALAMLALVSAGCASAAVRYVYIKTGTTAEQRDQDESECTRLAMIRAGRSSADGSSHETLDRARLKQCMADRGYEVQEVKS